jgi:hypothetical protein
MKNVNAQHQRILARRLARELTKEELVTIAGGWKSSSVTTCADLEGGVDGGSDD